MIDDPTTMDESNLRYHGETTIKVYDSDAVWVADLVGDDPETAIAVLGLKYLSLVGELGTLIDRLTAAVRLLEAAREQPEQWDLLLPRRFRQGDRSLRTWSHPFTDRGRLDP